MKRRALIFLALLGSMIVPNAYADSPADAIDMVEKGLAYVKKNSVEALIKEVNNKNPKLAGIMFILAGLFAFVLSLTSILLYIAGILCFTRKAPLTDETTFVENQYDDTLRPL